MCVLLYYGYCLGEAAVADSLVVGVSSFSVVYERAYECVVQTIGVWFEAQVFSSSCILINQPLVMGCVGKCVVRSVILLEAVGRYRCGRWLPHNISAHSEISLLLHITWVIKSFSKEVEKVG